MKKKKTTRREFMTKAVVATSAVAVGSVFPPLLRAQTPCDKETLQEIGKIVSKDKVLKGVLKIKNTRKNLPGYTGSQKPMMRYFEGWDQNQGEGSIWPPASQAADCLPGPTLRVGVGERVEITFLNNTRVSDFGLTYDNAETGASDGCDQVSNFAVNPPVQKWYPDARGDVFPNCFHASSSANLHFHGTHITPDAFGDNVLVQIRPDPALKEGDVKAMFDPIFAQCRDHPGHVPTWDEVPGPYPASQKEKVRNYDLTAIWKGKRGPKMVDGKEEPELPYPNQLSPKNDKLIEDDRWPAYFIGAYPSCFTVTEAAGHEMGQAPGTHWYHAHKHGSTAINLFNGLAGVLIIEGQYDKDLKAYYKELNKGDLKEKVMIVQTFTDQPNMERAATNPRPVLTNGQSLTGSNPATIVMRPGEIQLWRIVNATVFSTINSSFTGTAPLPSFKQIAQDGVQFNWTNYTDQPLTSPSTSDPNKFGTKFSLAPGGRIDLLVKAPATAGTFVLTGIVNLKVCGEAMNDSFPTEANYPAFPPFLNDITEQGKTNDLSFDWEPFRLTFGIAAPSKFLGGTYPKFMMGKREVQVKQNNGPYFMLDGRQFDDDKFDQTMVLGEIETWTLYNTTSITHPFHIHVNPFQVIEVYDPNTPANSFKRETNGVWQDVINIPAAKKDPASGNLILDPNTGKPAAKDRGYVRFRSRFADFAGSFVLHCHILAHEDRGMMQLVQVIDPKSPYEHH